MLKPARERNDFTWMGLGGRKQEHRLNNWNPWINSNLLVTNLILEDDPALRVAETVRIARSVDAYWNDYWPDAAEEEGPGYYSRSVLSLFEVIWALDSATGNATTIFANPFLDAMGRFILNAHIAGDDYLAYGDAHRHSAPPGDVLYRFGKAVHDAELEEFGAFYAAKEGWNAKGPGLERAHDENDTSLSRALPAVLDADEIRNARKEDVLVREAWYPEFGLMTAREKAGSTDGMYVAVLASNNGRSHSHNDTGNFVIYLDGQPVAIDVGVEAYTAKTFRPRSLFHLDHAVGVSQPAHRGRRDAAQWRGVLSNGSQVSRPTIDMRWSHSILLRRIRMKRASKWIRTVTLDRARNTVIILDEFDLERALPVSLSIMTPRIPTIEGRSVALKLAGESGRTCRLDLHLTPLDAKIETIELSDAGLRESWGAEIYRILLNAQPVATGRWTYEFTAS